MSNPSTRVVLVGSPFSKLKGGQGAVAEVLERHFAPRYTFSTSKAARASADAGVVLVPVAASAVTRALRRLWPGARIAAIEAFVRTEATSRAVAAILEELKLVPAAAGGRTPSPDAKAPDAPPVPRKLRRKEVPKGPGHEVGRDDGGNDDDDGDNDDDDGEDNKTEEPPLLRVAQSGGTKPDGKSAGKRLFRNATNDAGMCALLKEMGTGYLYVPKPSPRNPPDMIVTPDGSPASRTKRSAAAASGKPVMVRSLAEFLRIVGRIDLITKYKVTYPN